MNPMNKNPSVTICIPAYNEEKEIKGLLESVVAQKTEDYHIDSIIVLSDGSSDQTVSLAKSVHDPRITVIDGKTNNGRITRRNELLRMATTDIMIFLDGDGVLEDSNSIGKLITPFLNDPFVALVGGNPFSTGNNTFLAKGLAIPRDAYLDFKYQINEGNNILGCMGSMLAISKDFYTKITIPEDIDADDAYMYLLCKSTGYTFKNVKDAKVLHKFPETISAHVKRNSRHARANKELKKYFGDLVDREYAVPRYLYLLSMSKQFIKDPVHATFVYALNAYARILAKV